mgnify:CR=1 FL=1
MVSIGVRLSFVACRSQRMPWVGRVRLGASVAAGPKASSLRRRAEREVSAQNCGLMLSGVVGMSGRKTV